MLGFLNFVVMALVGVAAVVAEQTCNFRYVVAGGDNACALADDGTATCWGAAWHGRAEVLRAPEGKNVSAISTSVTHTCIIDPDGIASCRSPDDLHKFAPNFSAEHSGNQTRYAKISAGVGYTCGITADGKGLCWGTDGLDFLGEDPQQGIPNSLVISPSNPENITYVEISATTENSASCARISSDEISCWPGTLITWSSFASAPNFPTNVKYVQVDAGNYYACALTSDGQIICQDNTGTFSRDDTGVKAVPALYKNVRYVQLAVGALHVCALTSVGDVVCWGEGGDGQLDVTPLPSGMSYTLVAAGDGHSCALRSDKAVICWGFNNAGQANAPHCNTIMEDELYPRKVQQS